MAAIKITNFGGLIPSVSEKALPPDNAKVAQNLMPQLNEFRPSLAHVTYAEAVAVEGDFDPATIFRFALDPDGDPWESPEDGWIGFAVHTHLAKWPVHDEDAERHSVVSDDGSTTPAVIDNEGEDRQLGVPAPVQPTLALNAGSYFTQEERDAGVEAGRAAVLAAMLAELVPAKIGPTLPGTATTGFVDWDVLRGGDLNLRKVRAYRYSAIEGTISDAYSAVADESLAWVSGSGKGEWYTADGGDPSWMSSAAHYLQPYTAYGLGYTFDSAGASTALTAINGPDGSDLLTATAVTALIDAAEDALSTSAAGAKGVIAALVAAVAEFEAVLETAISTSDFDLDAVLETMAARIHDEAILVAGSI